MKIALVQMNCDKGEIARNVQRAIEFCIQAAESGADIVCFPEASLTGYIDPLRFPDAVISWDNSQLAPLFDWFRNNPITGVLGIVERNSSGAPFIAQGVIKDGELQSVYHKTHLAPEELSHFSADDELCIVSHHGKNLGLSVCADIESEDLFRRYSEAGAQVVLHASAPGLYGEQATRNWQSGYDWWHDDCQAKLGMYAQKFGLTIAAATQSGRTVDEDFPGGGYLFDQSGALVSQTSDWSEGMLIVEVS